MTIYIGSNEILDAKLGADQVQKLYLGETEVWNSTPPTPPVQIKALKFETAGSNHLTIGLLGSLSPVFEYSNDGETWNSYTMNTQLAFGGDTPLYIRGTNTKLVDRSSTRVYFSFDSYTTDTNLVDCTGNVMHLYDYTQDLTSFPSGSGHGLQLLFAENTSLRTPPSLPALDISNAIFCYNATFKNCTHLSAIPLLPATIGSSSCYGDTFNGCSLIKMSETRTGEYTNEYTFGIEIGNYGIRMFENTGGTFTGTATAQTYYTANEVIS